MFLRQEAPRFQSLWISIIVIKLFLLFVSIEASRQYNAILVGHTLCLKNIRRIICRYLSRNTLVSHFEIEKNRNIIEIIFKGKNLTRKQALSLWFFFRFNFLIPMHLLSTNIGLFNVISQKWFTFWRFNWLLSSKYRNIFFKTRIFVDT